MNYFHWRRPEVIDMHSNYPGSRLLPYSGLQWTYKPRSQKNFLPRSPWVFWDNINNHHELLKDFVDSDSKIIISRRILEDYKRLCELYGSQIPSINYLISKLDEFDHISWKKKNELLNWLNFWWRLFYFKNGKFLFTDGWFTPRHLWINYFDARKITLENWYMLHSQETIHMCKEFAYKNNIEIDNWYWIVKSWLDSWENPEWAAFAALSFDLDMMSVFDFPPDTNDEELWVCYLLEV